MNNKQSRSRLHDLIAKNQENKDGRHFRTVLAADVSIFSSIDEIVNSAAESAFDTGKRHLSAAIKQYSSVLAEAGYRTGHDLKDWVKTDQVNPGTRDISRQVQG